MSHRLYFDAGVSRFHTDKNTREEPTVLRLVWWRDDEPEPRCRLIKPQGEITIDPSTVPYHAVTTEWLFDGELHRQADVVDEFGLDSEDAEQIIAYHADFHWRALHKMMGVVGVEPPVTAICGMKIATPVLAIPAMRPGGGWKSPSLREACRFFNVPEPNGDDPFTLALTTIHAVRGVYEACQQEPTD